jgi:anhydro-N-acetylmuramic acid kinase
MSTTMTVLGMISGTSHDGIDAAVVDFSFADDGVLEGIVGHRSVTPYDPGLRSRLRSALPPTPTTLSEICQLDTLIGQAFAEVAAGAERATRAAGRPLDAIASHGQTVFHWVDGTTPLGTLQIGQPAWIAERTGVPVVSDVRIRDMTVGGQGAPLVAFLDTLLLRGRASGAGIAALNLGGISNMTVLLPGRDPYAYDIGPANALLDAVIADRPLRNGTSDSPGYDEDGRIAASGAVDDALLSVLLEEPYYALPVPKTTGKELFHLEYVQAALARSGREPALPDLLATLTELTAVTVAHDVKAAGIGTLVVSGGGCANGFLMRRLASALDGVELVRSDELGAPTDTKEAIAFALIGWCTLHGVPANEPTATGAAERRVLGTITPGRTPLVLPPPHETPLPALRLTVRG